MTGRHDRDPYSQKSIELEDQLKTDPAGAFIELQALAPESPACMLLLGRAYDKGLGTAADPKKAEVYLRQAASEGAGLGYYYLGEHYFEQENYAEARKALRRGVAVGEIPSRDALEMVELKLAAGKAYEMLNSEPELATAALRMLAEKGSPDSMLGLGWAYQQGLGVPCDPRQAREWYRKAYEGGLEGAGTYLGYYEYYDGWKHLQTDPKDYKKAFESFAQGARLGYGPAAYRLAGCYAKGLGVERRPEEARHLYEKAAALGNLPAMREVAKLHIRGSYGLAGIWKGVTMYINCLRETYRVARRDLSDIRLLK